VVECAWLRAVQCGTCMWDVVDAVYTQACMGSYVECAAMIVRMRRAMMNCCCRVCRSLDVFVLRMADVCDDVNRGLA
jgi:hypothetical protein